MYRLMFLLALLLPVTLARAMSVGFINPGRHDEAFWVLSGQTMQAAANSLGIELEQQFAERDPQRALQIAREIAARPASRRPRYVVLVNEKGMLVPAARILEAAGIRTFAAYSGLLPQEAHLWAPRKGLPLLLGSLEPDAESASYLSTRALIELGRQRRLQGPDGLLHLLAIAGDRSTPVSIARNQGMRRALDEQGGVVLEQTVFGDWRLDRGAALMRELLPRHPESHLVWTGSDQMALGAMQAARAQGLAPGRDLLFSSINTSRQAMQALIDGDLSVLAGGHFICGAWALVLLYDYEHGRDFADEGLTQTRPMFMLFDKTSAKQYLARYGQGVPSLDFRPQSRVLNPQLKRYAFELAAMMR